MASRRSPRSTPARRTVFLDAMRGMNDIIVRGSEGGMYVMLDIRAIEPDCEKFAWGLLDAEKVTVMPGSSFGDAAAGHIRISLCQPDDVLKDAANRLRRFAARLSGARPREQRPFRPRPAPSSSAAAFPAARSPIIWPSSAGPTSCCWSASS